MFQYVRRVLSLEDIKTSPRVVSILLDLYMTLLIYPESGRLNLAGILSLHLFYLKSRHSTPSSRQRKDPQLLVNDVRCLLLPDLVSFPILPIFQRCPSQDRPQSRLLHTCPALLRPLQRRRVLALAARAEDLCPSHQDWHASRNQKAMLRLRPVGRLHMPRLKQQLLAAASQAIAILVPCIITPVLP